MLCAHEGAGVFEAGFTLGKGDGRGFLSAELEGGDGGWERLAGVWRGGGVVLNWAWCGVAEAGWKRKGGSCGCGSEQKAASGGGHTRL